jgi:hypothetical protein
MLMLIAGAAGGVISRNWKFAFIAGFLGVGVAWSILFLFLNEFFQGKVIAEFFATILGLQGWGRWVQSLSVILGGLLGGTGAITGRLLFEIIKPEEPQEESNDADAPQYIQPMW